MFGLEHKLDVKVGYTRCTSPRPNLADILQLSLDISQNYSFITQLNLEEFLMIHIKVTFIFYFFVFCQYHEILSALPYLSWLRNATINPVCLYCCLDR